MEVSNSVLHTEMLLRTKKAAHNSKRRGRAIAQFARPNMQQYKPRFKDAVWRNNQHRGLGAHPYIANEHHPQ